MKKNIFALSFFAMTILVVIGVKNSYAHSSFLEVFNWSSLLLGPGDPLPPIDLEEKEKAAENPIQLDVPEGVVEEKVEYDPESDSYIFTESLGDDYLSAPTNMSFEDYLEWRSKQQEKAYFEAVAKDGSGTSDDDPISGVNIKSKLVDRLFGPGGIQITPQGNVDVTLGGDFQRIENPILTEAQRSQGGFDFDMAIKMNVVGKIGEKLNLSANYNTQATFDFENQLKLEYTGYEDDIIKKIEAGNVSFPLRTSLISGSQSLFGFKSQLQFGRLTLTSVFSQQKSQKKNLTIQGGAQLQQFDIPIDRYDENRHFFVSHYNKNAYDLVLQNLPQKNTLFQITKMEVWVTNDRNATEDVRDIVAVADLGEGNLVDLGSTNGASFLPGPLMNFDLVTGNILPSDSSNIVYSELLSQPKYRALNSTVSSLETGVLGLQQTRDFMQVRGRLLSSSEYTYDPQLGFISLNLTLQPDQTLAVAYEYTYNGKVYKVGEFSNDVPVDPDQANVLFVKMLKSSASRVDIPMWDLMMKNIYSLGAYQVSAEDFKLDVYYQDPGEGEKRFLPFGVNTTGVPLISLFNLDNLNSQGDPQPDGVFDFVNGVTINPQNGRLIFPVREPFGDHLRNQFDLSIPAEVSMADSVVFQPLYDSTITTAKEFPELNRFMIRGTYKSSFTSDIALGAFNIPRNSVTVNAGGRVLTEGVDYDVDYNIGRVRILNESILNSGAPINVSFEDNSLFSFQTKTLFGTRADFWINDNFTLGGTFMSLKERPFTQKVNFGDDPINNKIYGFDVQYKHEAPWLTRTLDKLPLYQTKEPSEIAFTGEVAYLDPGTNKAVELDGEATVYIDDFEGSSSSIDLRTPTTSWVIASTPRNDVDNNNPLFPESSLSDSLVYGMNRALLNWYRIDNSLRSDAPTSPYDRLVNQQEVFPNIDLVAGQNPQIITFDMTYYPDEKGPYNYDVNPIPNPAGGFYTEGVDANGRLNKPETRWGGMMRSLSTTDFEAANVEFIDLWVLSPFISGAGGNGGDLYINLGNVSEDILRDSRNTFENGLPNTKNQTITADSTKWGLVPKIQAITNSFDTDTEVRSQQDVGLDGLNDNNEASYFSDYLAQIQTVVNTTTYNRIQSDPSNDNFLYYNDDSFSDGDGISDRYKRYNNPQSNSQAATGSVLSASTNIPDTEDINKDNSLNQSEDYYQYKVSLKPSATPGEMDDNGFIVSEVEGENGQKWYQMRIPVDQFSSKVGNISDFRSIQFLRMYMHGFDEQITLRFAKMELVRNQWRRYSRDLSEKDITVDPADPTDFNVASVNIIENGSKLPFRYVLPNDIQREESLTQFSSALQNEQSMEISVCDLQDGDSRGIYKTLNFDMRDYERLSMYVHAEADPASPFTFDEDLRAFIRIGSDFVENYYEYEVPLYLTDPADATLSGESYADAVWDTRNEMSFDLDLLVNAKIKRNSAGTPFNERFTLVDPDNNDKTITVIGNPDIGLAKQVMIGVHNPSDDNRKKCGKIWVNELRLSGLDQKGGFAGLARLDAKLADLGTMTASTSYKGIGWGALEQKVAERSKEKILEFDVSTNLNLDKFIPKKLGLKVPFYAQYSRKVTTPEYDPYSYDVKLDDLLDDATGERKDSLREQARELEVIKSYNFTNVRKERKKGDLKPKPWDVENISLTYAYTEHKRTDPTIKKDLNKNYKGALSYNYSTKPKYIEPLKDKEWKSKYLNIVKAFNFNPVPNSLTFSTGVNRYFNSITYRFADENNNTYYDKRFTWDRTYGLRWNLAKNLNLDFNAQNSAVIDEPEGLLDTKAERDSVWTNVFDFGRTKNYTHKLNSSYTLPLKQLPITDWMKVKASYGTDYGWSASSLNVDSLGNVIQNSNNIQVTGDLDFVRLYNKSKYLKNVNTKAGRFIKSPKKPKSTTAEEGEEKKKPKKQVNRSLTPFEKLVVRPLMSVRKVKLTYAYQRGTVLPGYKPSTQVLGLNESFTAPGAGFIFGAQPSTQWLDDAATDGWITDNLFFNQQFLQNTSKNFNAKITLEPYKGFRIDMNVERTFTENHSENFKVQNAGEGFRHLSPLDVGSLKMSFFTLRTVFDGLDGNNLSKTFKQFEANRAIVSKRLGSGIHAADGDEFVAGKGKYSQEVLIPSFIAAYTDRDASTIKTDPLKLLPLPNWRINYSGLSKVPIVKKYFKTVNLSHSYKSTFTINQFSTDLDYDSGDPFKLNPNTQNYYSEYEIPDILIQEKLSPLIGINVRMKNDISARFDYKKSRTLAMSFTDYQLNETKTTEYTVGMGYRVKNVYIKFLDFSKKTKKIPNSKTANKDAAKGSTAKKGSDLNIKLDFSIRDDLTTNHLLDQNINVPTRGLKTIRIAPAVDYALNKNLNLRLFYDYSRTIPATSASFPITNTQAGLTIRFSIQ